MVLLPCISCNTAQQGRSLSAADTRRFAAAGARRCIQIFVFEWQAGRFEMQTVVGFALGGQELAGLADDLLKHRHPESVPQAVPILLRQAVRAGTAKNDQSM